MITVSIVSHGHNEWVNSLVKKLTDVTQVSTIVVIENIEQDIKIWKSPKVKLISNELPLGFGENHNNASKHIGKGDYFLVLNPDVEFTCAIEATLRHLLDDIGERKGVFSPKHVDKQFGAVSSRRAYLSITGLIKRQFGINYESNDYWLPGAFMLFSPDVFESILFDDLFFMYCEDMDICKRTKLGGYEVGFVDNEYPIIHEGQRQSKKSVIHFIFHITSLVRYFYKWRFK